MQPSQVSDEAKAFGAPVILQVAKAINSHLELSDVLAALVTSLKPLVPFDSVGIVVREGDFAKLHSLHIEGLQREVNESPQQMLERKAQHLNIDEPLHTRIPISEHPMSEIIKSGAPYASADLESQRR